MVFISVTVHPDVFTKSTVSPKVKRDVVKKVYVGNYFTNEQDFEVRNHMLKCIHTEASKLRFCVLIGRSDNGSNRKGEFVSMTCERSGKYRPASPEFQMR